LVGIFARKAPSSLKSSCWYTPSQIIPYICPKGCPILAMYKGTVSKSLSQFNVLVKDSWFGVRDNTLFLLKAILMEEFQLKSFPLMISPDKLNSKPSLLVLPIFLNAEAYPVEVGNCAFNNKSVVFFL